MQQLTPASFTFITAAAPAANYLICMFYQLNRKPELKMRLLKPPLNWLKKYKTDTKKIIKIYCSSTISESTFLSILLQKLNKCMCILDFLLLNTSGNNNQQAWQKTLQNRDESWVLRCFIGWKASFNCL